MKNLIGALLGLTLFVGHAWADSGIKRDGMYLTFDEAKVPLTQVPLDQVPGLQNVITVIKGLDVDETLRRDLLRSVYSTDVRRYYSIDKISSQEETRLRTMYAATIKAKSSDIVQLFAVSDVESHETFLLPEFFKLNGGDLSRAKVLFHEGIWLNSRGSADYYDIVSLDYSFATYFSNFTQGKDVYLYDLYEKLGSIFSESNLPLVSALSYDIRQGRLAKTFFGDMSPRSFADEGIFRLIVKESRVWDQVPMSDPLVLIPATRIIRIILAKDFQEQVSDMAVNQPDEPLYHVLAKHGRDAVQLSNFISGNYITGRPNRFYFLYNPVVRRIVTIDKDSLLVVGNLKLESLGN